MDIVNVGIFANIDAGKTSLTECLYTITYGVEGGSVKRGTTISDSNIIEKEEGFLFSLQLFLFIMGITKLILCEEKCTTPHITDEQIHDWSVKAINHVLQNKDEIIDNLTVLLNQLMNQSELEFEIETLTKQLENIHQQVVDLVGQNAKVTQSQKDYHETYQKLVEQYEQCEKQQQQKISSRLLKNNRVK